MNKKLLKKYLIGEFSFKRLVRSAIIIYLCVVIYGWIRSDSMIFQPHAPGYSDTDDIIKIEMPNGVRISALYFENKAAEYTVLYNHANAVDLGDLPQYLALYRSKGFSIFTYDYPGYGTSDGQPSTSGAYMAADAAMDYLINTAGVKENTIIIHGRSVGGGPALHLAKKWNVTGLIVESAFVTAFRTLTNVPLAPVDKFRNIAKIGKVNCPVLVIHGKEDHTIPFWHGEKLFKKAKDPKMSCWLDDSDHNYMSLVAEEKYWQAITSFTNLINQQQVPVKN